MSVSEIVSQARSQGLYLLVFLRNATSPNENLKNISTSAPVKNLLKQLPGLEVVIDFDTVDFKNFCGVYDETPKGKQALVLINGKTSVVEVYVNEDDNATIGGFSVQMVTVLQKAKAAAASSATTASTSTSASTTTNTTQPTLQEKTQALNQKLNQKRQEKAQAEAQKQIDKEKQRRLDGIKMAEQKRKQEEEEMADIAKKRKAEKLDDKMAMDKVKKLLAEDKEKRRLKNEEEMAKAKALKAGSSNTSTSGSTSANENVLIMFILPDGSRPRNNFNKNSQKISNLFEFVQEKTGSSCKLKNNLDNSDIKYSEKDLGSLVGEKKTFQIKVLNDGKMSFSSSSSKAKSGQNSAVSKPIDLSVGAIFSNIMYLILFVPNLIFKTLQDVFSSAQAGLETNRRNGFAESDQRDPNSSSSMSNNNNSTNNTRPRFQNAGDIRKRTGRIHDLKRDDEDSSFNGNSTAHDRQ